MFYKTSLIAHDCAHCSGVKDAHLCKLCARNCVGSEFGSPFFVSPPMGDGSDCGYYIGVEPIVFMTQLVRDWVVEGKAQ